MSVTYLTFSLTFNPKIAEIRVEEQIQALHLFGMFVSSLMRHIIVLYATIFVMKNRVKELEEFMTCGLEKRHLFSMTPKKSKWYGILTVLERVSVLEPCLTS